MGGPWRYAPAGGANSPEIAWTTLDLSAGSVYGNAAAVTARTSTTITIDSSVNTGTAFLDNSPDNRATATAWFSQTVDASAWTSGTPGLVLLDITREAAPPQDGSYLGIAIHSSADPTASTYYSGIYIRRRSATYYDAWAINDWGTLGGYSNSYASRSRLLATHTIPSERTDLANWSIRPLAVDGGEPASTFYLDLSSKSWRTFDVSGGLYVSLFAGNHFHGIGVPGSYPAPAVHTPVALRYAVVPFGANP